MDHRGPRLARPLTLCVTLPSAPRQGFYVKTLHSGLPFFPGKQLKPRPFVVYKRKTQMASNAVVFFAGVGSTFVILTAGFSSGLAFTKAAFDDTRAPARVDLRPPPSVRVVLPAYGEPASSAAPVIDEHRTALAMPEAQPVREASKPVAQVSMPDPKTVEANLRAERRKQAERKARKVAAAKARQDMIVQNQLPPRVMAFGGDGPHLIGN